ncbi:HIT-like protein [Aaosphaeria arxii CBS 175.79]|uniref:HIT-like protein n=1 Tax=Aaosphaeria arxii CBS 175.79 TaxID=1450172 RepID=A0A6A5XZY7_9PLEO|nr:HIT-like protein [Aaosphaeria arxii CBS 175.79]KAF2018835.1 HIT-like protein [Aaosphaeria arxii CBS 175.79]
MNELDLHYPPDTCPFCNIAVAFETLSPSPSPTSPSPSSSPPAVEEDLPSCIPSDDASDPAKTTPSSFVVLASRNVVAFLDILPMTRGHLLVATRGHRVKVEDMEGGEARDVGFWLPLLARTVKKVTGVSDYNIVQNNGARAAQVVPHVHFHIIPRPASMPQIKSKSWTMFGRGNRDDLDDEEGAALAGEMRRILREEVERLGARGKL